MATTSTSRPASPIPTSHSLDDQDEDVRIAVRALGDMRNRKTASARASGRAPAPTSPSFSSTPASGSGSASTGSTPASSLPSPQITPAQQGQQQGQFVSRVSHLPLVGTALRAYDYGKNSSRVVKYGAQMVESSIQAVSRPLIDRLPVNVERLDEFACQQLDRLDRYRRPSSSSLPSSSSDTTPTPTSEIPADEECTRGRKKTFDGTPERGSSRTSERTDDTAMQAQQIPQGERQQGGQGEEGEEGAVVQRSRWQAVLLEAGGLGAALSEESMRRLKYCLQWLQYATAHIDAQILILREFIASLQPLPSTSTSTSSRPPISEEHLRKLTAVRRDIVHTIRQVVDVVSKYAGGALPEPARGRVRGFILKLPQRWASATRAAGVPSAIPMPVLTSAGEGGGRERERERELERETVAAAASGGGVRRRGRGHRERGAGGANGDGYRSGASSRATSPASSPRLARLSMTPGTSTITTSSRHAHMPPPSAPSEEQGGQQVTHGSAALAAQRILTLATESLDMMRGVTGVVKESLDRADAWVGRLRTVGLASSSASSAQDEEMAPPSPSFRTHTRNISTTSEDHPPSLFFSSSASSTTSSLPSTPFPGFPDGMYSVPGSPGKLYSVPGSPVPGSPIASAIGRMSIASRYSTPKMGVVGLPLEEEGVLSGERLGVKRESGEGMDVDV